MDWFWTTCAVILVALAALNFYTLWRGRRAPWGAGEWFSPFTLATQAGFALFAAVLLLGEVEGFEQETGVMAGELLLLALMLVGFASDWRQRRA